MTSCTLDGDFESRLLRREQTAIKKERNTYESSATSVIWILALRARSSIRWRPSSVWSPLVTRRKRRRVEGEEGEEVRKGEGVICHIIIQMTDKSSVSQKVAVDIKH